MPAWSASLITDRILVPKIWCRCARSSRSSRVSMGFMSCTPSCSGASPRSTFRNGTTFFSSHRYRAVGTPLISRSMVCSNRIAARIRVPSNAGLVITRVRMAWTRSNISSSVPYRSRSMPYSASALGVLPPLWSSAAKKPWPPATFSACAVFTLPHCVTSPARLASVPAVRSGARQAAPRALLQVKGEGDGAADLIADLPVPVQLIELGALRADQLVAQAAGVRHAAVAVLVAERRTDPLKPELEQLPVHIRRVLVHVAVFCELVEPGQAGLGDPLAGRRLAPPLLVALGEAERAEQRPQREPLADQRHDHHDGGEED